MATPTRKPKREDIAGQKFNRWTAIRYSHNKKNHVYWIFKCDCGTIKAVMKDQVKRGVSKSCGCYRSENTTKMKTTHGRSNTRTFKIWQGMRKRCLNKSYRQYRYYGGRGIKICSEWDSFENFLNDMGEPNFENASIDRIDNNGDYEPNNCRWATNAQQARNMSSNNILEYNGEKKCVAEWAEEYQIKYDTLLARVKRGWSMEDALNKPIGRQWANRNRKI